jgi:CheY-like chemotaxis protein
VAPFDLNEVLSESVATLSAAVEQKGLRLSLDVASGIWPYRQGDPERLQQVLMNLLGNAIKFTAEGSIHLRARPVEGEADGECLRFEVSDTGCGIPKGQEEMIFKAFQQVDGAMNRTHEGTGLGLSITKSLVELMGGRIWVEPKESPGTQLVFTVCLPRATKHAVNSHMEKSRTVTKARGLKPGTRILIAEDNEENLFLLQSYLKGQSAIVEIAANGVVAVQKRQENHYDVILMDIQMPLMDGLAATRVIRAWEAKHESARMPIVALTAHALSGAAAECREAGCDGYLSKPVQRGDLMQTIIRFSASGEVPSNAAGGQAQPTPSPVDAGIRALRPRYLANRGNDIKAMRAALEICDFGAIKRIAHDSKGTGTGYGFPEISALSKILENAAIQSDAAAVAARIAEMEEIVSSSAV